jgi:arsenate reductase
MPTILFYEKPGCATNQLQKELLRVSGFELDVRNLLREPWTLETLRPFFGDKPVHQWFNHSAPAIKYGNIDPFGLSGEQAIELMLSQPILIRRPLIRFGSNAVAGFDNPQILALLAAKGVSSVAENLHGCSHASTPGHRCPQPVASP